MSKPFVTHSQASVRATHIVGEEVSDGYIDAPLGKLGDRVTARMQARNIDRTRTGRGRIRRRHPTRQRAYGDLHQKERSRKRRIPSPAPVIARELAYLNARGITYATICWGPYDESVRYRDFMRWDVPLYSVGVSADILRAGRTPNEFMLGYYLRKGGKVFETYWTSGRGVEGMTPTLALFGVAAYGRREDWEDSPKGWPKPLEVGSSWRSNVRPTSQWPRLEAGRSHQLSGTK